MRSGHARSGEWCAEIIPSHAGIDIEACVATTMRTVSLIRMIEFPRRDAPLTAGGQDHRPARGQHLGRDHGGDGVGGVVEAVDELEHERGQRARPVAGPAAAP